MVNNGDTIIHDNYSNDSQNLLLQPILNKFEKRISSKFIKKIYLLS
jgi:hypothetical protein